MEIGDIVIAKIISDGKIGYIVVEIQGRVYRVYRPYLPLGMPIIPGSFIQLEVCEGNLAEGEVLLLKYYGG